MFHLEHRCGISYDMVLGNTKFHVMPGHQRGQLAAIELRSLICTDYFTGTEHRDTVSHGKHFIELVRNETNRHPGCLERTNGTEQTVHFSRGQRGSRFIHKDDLRVQRQSSGNSNLLLGRHG